MKKTIKTNLNTDCWINELDGKTIQQAVHYLQEFDNDLIDGSFDNNEAL